MTTLETDLTDNAKPVDVGGHVSYEFDDIGQKVDWKGDGESGQNNVFRVFFETESGNMYSFDPATGALIDSNQSVEEGVAKVIETDIKCVGLIDWEVGSRALFILKDSRVWRTSRAKRFVVVTNEVYPDKMKGQVPKSNINTKFDEKMKGVDGYTSPFTTKENVGKEKQDVSKYVDVGDGRIAIQLNNEGEELPLSNMFSDHQNQNRRVVFTTKTGNMYSLDLEGILVNAGKGGREYSLNPETLKHLILKVGNPFYHPFEPRVIQTTPIKDIIYITGEEYSDGINSNIPKSDILERFEETKNKTKDFFRNIE